MVSEWKHLREHSILVGLLGGYFGMLAILEIVHWSMLKEELLYSAIVVFKFIVNCALLVGLVQFSAIRRDAEKA